MMIRLQNAADKATIYKKMDNLKQANKGRDRPYFITDQLPEAWAERKKYIHFLKQQNQKLPVAQQLKATVKDGSIKFNDQEYILPVHAPTVSEFLNLPAERRKVIRELDVIQGKDEVAQESIFIGYAAQVFSTKQVEDYYYLVKLLNPEATHIMCAFKLPGVDFTKLQGSIDDGEHAGGRTLLNLLLKDQQINCALFVVRHYGGKHLGQLRFSLIEKTANDALSKLKEHVRKMQQPPTQEELQEYMQQHIPSNSGWSMDGEEETWSQDESQQPESKDEKNES